MPVKVFLRDGGLTAFSQGTGCYPADYTAQAEADLPTSGFAAGSSCYCLQENSFWRATANDVWTLQTSGNISGAWPIGSVFCSVVDTNPATLLGFGTWTAFGTGRVLAGLDTADPDFDTLEKIGGTKTAPATGTVAAPVFTGSPVAASDVSAGIPSGSITWPAGMPVFAGIQGVVPAETITWPAAVPTFTGNALNTSLVSAGTPAGTNNAPAFTGTPLGSHAHETPIQITTGTTQRHISSATFGTGTSRAAVQQWTSSANATSAACALTQAVSAGTPAGTVAAPVFTGTPLGTHQHSFTATGSIAWPANVPTNQTVNFTPLGTITWPASVPTFAGNALGIHNHTVTAAGTNNAPAFTGSPTTIVQPYIVVRFWKRTA